MGRLTPTRRCWPRDALAEDILEGDGAMTRELLAHGWSLKSLARRRSFKKTVSDVNSCRSPERWC